MLLPLKIYRVKASWRATSKTLLIRASTPEAAIKKAAKLKENKDVLDLELVDTKDDDRLLGI